MIFQLLLLLLSSTRNIQLLQHRQHTTSSLSRTALSYVSLLSSKEQSSNCSKQHRSSSRDAG